MGGKAENIGKEGGKNKMTVGQRTYTYLFSTMSYLPMSPQSSWQRSQGVVSEKK